MRDDNYKNFSTRKVEKAMLGVIYILEKDNERLRMINKQYKVKYRSWMISLALYKEIIIS